MSVAAGTPWQALARSHGIDPDEVRLVYERYEAHRQFAGRGSGEPIELARWFGFYRMEKASEGEQAGPAPSGCSVDSDAVNNACISRPAEFLAVLKAFAAERGPA
jgi:hypothetical protein